jgi:hypothetical protein
MLSDTDKKEMEEHFSKHYLLIPKNRVYHVAGGILGVLILGLGISYQAVLKVLDSQMANEARQNIMTVEKNVTAAQQRIDGLERDATSAADWLRSTAVQESNAAKQRIAEVEQAGKEAAEKLAATTIESLKAKRIALVDGNGKEKVVLNTTTTGSGLLWLYDSADRKRLQLAENSDGYAGLYLLDYDGRSRLSLQTDSAGLPSLHLYDSTKKKRVQLYEDESGYAGLSLLDRRNTSRMKLMTEPETGLPALEMYDDKGAIRSSSPHPQPSSAASPVPSVPQQQ